MKKTINLLKSLLLCTCLLGSSKIAAIDWPMGLGQEEGQFQIWGDYLYWKAVQEQAVIAAVIPGGIDAIITDFTATPINAVIRPSVVNPRFNFSSGFRIGASYNLPCANWNFDLSWTRYHNKVRTRFTEGNSIFPLNTPGVFVAEILTGNIAAALADRLVNSWRIEYDSIDLKVGREFQYFECSSVNPWVGVKAVRIKQNHKTAFEGFEIDGIALDVSSYKKNEFRGIGPSVGVDGMWEIYSNINLSTGFSGALLCGKFDVIQRPQVDFATNSVEVISQNNRKDRIRPMVDMFVGLDWDPSFCDFMQLNIGVGYEVQYWWNQWQVPGSLAEGILSGGTSPQGDLMLFGLTVHASLVF